MLIKNGTYLNEDMIFVKGDINVIENKINILNNGSFETEDIFNAENYYIIPGLINTHTHIPMNLMKGVADHLPLIDWLQQVIFPVEGKYVSPEFVYFGAILGAIETIKTGTTSVVDMYYLSKDIAKALKEIGLRGFLGVGPGDFINNTNPVALEFIDEYKNNDLIHPTMFAHAIYTTSENAIKWVKETADKYNLPYQFHLNEAKEENINFKNQYGINIVKHLENIGFLSERLIAAHCVWLNDDDIEIMKKYNVTVSHNSHSNLKLNSGIMPLKKYIDSGLNVTLGTDGAASNNHLNLMLEMDLAAKLYYYSSNKPVHPNNIFELTTKNAAKPLLMENKLGVIKENAFADLVFINKNDFSMIPSVNPISNIVFSNPQSAIDHVMINGKFVLKNKTIVNFDEQEFYKELNKYLKTLKLEDYYHV